VLPVLPESDPRLNAPAFARPWVLATIGIGANLGDALANVKWALTALHTLPLSRWVRESGLYRSAPRETLPGHAAGDDYVNAVAQIETQLSAPALLQALQALEQRQGRERPYRNAPRSLDLDLLLYGDAQIDSPQLQVPHPRMYSRAFVLLPLAEIAPHSVSADALAAVRDQGIEAL
jgi:2-amino-4-hydroxy-6-hydroxymethyldihydropteridine diphosphokinase